MCCLEHDFIIGFNYCFNFMYSNQVLMQVALVKLITIQGINKVCLRIHVNAL